MARKRERAFALVMALLFFVTAFGFSFMVIWQAVHSNSNSSKNTNNSKKTASAQQPDTSKLPVCSTTAPPAADINVEKKGSKLQGTQLADFTPCKVDKLQIIDVKQGTGPAATPSSTVTVDYTGAVAATGKIFQSSLDTGQPATFGLNQVIKGWMEGIPGMKVGGIRRLLIPAAEAYSANPPQGSGIPANADLVFDITMHKIQ